MGPETIQAMLTHTNRKNSDGNAKQQHQKHQAKGAQT
jgi:hypothetical protein